MSFDKFRKPDGNIDWAAYHASEVANGDICSKCGHFILFGGKGHPVECGSCREMETHHGEIRHEKYVRCPYCRHTFNPYDCEMFELLEEDCHDVSCPLCDKTFSVTTHITYSFRSPALVEENEREEETEDAPSV